MAHGLRRTRFRGHGCGGRSDSRIGGQLDIRTDDRAANGSGRQAPAARPRTRRRRPAKAPARGRPAATRRTA